MVIRAFPEFVDNNDEDILILTKFD